MPVELFVLEEHDQVYDFWRREGLRGLSVTHVDFHCDMRGLLIDRRRHTAAFVGRVSERRVDPGNYLAHAIMEGTVAAVRWVHGAHGGRRYDTGTVRFETDLTALPLRIRHAVKPYREVPLAFEEPVVDDWDGDVDGQHLDIDWDTFALKGVAPEAVDQATGDFLARDFAGRPEAIFLVFSPHYSRPERDRFEAFAGTLAGRFSARIVRVPLPADYPPVDPADTALSLKGRVVLGLHRVGIF